MFGSSDMPGWVGWVILLLVVVVVATLVVRAVHGRRTPKWWRVGDTSADDREREDELLRPKRHQWE